MTTAVSCTLFGAMSGSTQATVVAVGGPLRPRLLQAGYSDSFATALIINASDIALLIPPSIGMIVYGVVSGTSIGELFIAGIVPGLVILVLFCSYCWFASLRLEIADSLAATWPERWTALRRAILPLGGDLTRFRESLTEEETRELIDDNEFLNLTPALTANERDQFRQASETVRTVFLKLGGSKSGEVLDRLLSARELQSRHHD